MLLLPLAAGYGALMALRRLLYRRGWRSSERLGVPVVVVGNVLAGGAGKTPVVMAVIEHLQATGVSCGVVSRGYGRRTRDCREVTPDSDAGDVGDEPLLLARRCSVPVFVAARRVDAARALLARHPATQVLISDDGLQHLALGRDIEICVFDTRGVGNGWLLPAGPLRESWPRPTDLVLRPDGVAVEGALLARRLAQEAVRADGTRRALASLVAEAGADGVTAVAGIARPDVFFDMLRKAGVPLRHPVALPDHAAFAQPPQLPPHRLLLCTEKDAVKLWRHRPDAWAVPLVVQIEASFWSRFDRLLHPKLSSADGLQTA
ncbi:tetraacyldisaccharide 4'-kinase [Ramlibacter sp. AN1015]